MCPANQDEDAKKRLFLLYIEHFGDYFASRVMYWGGIIPPLMTIR